MNTVKPTSKKTLADDLEHVAAAIEADAGEPLPGLRASLSETAIATPGRRYTPAQLALREARTALGLSQQGFANLLQTPVGTVRDWEQGRFPPPGSALLVARLAVVHPEVLLPYTKTGFRCL
jgi:putative transcriptional regulator